MYKKFHVVVHERVALSSTHFVPLYGGDVCAYMPRNTAHFKEEFYTKEGVKLVNTTSEALKDLLRRHHPKLMGDWMTASSAFSLWNQLPEKPHWWPVYLRWGHVHLQPTRDELTPMRSIMRQVSN